MPDTARLTKAMPGRTMMPILALGMAALPAAGWAQTTDTAATSTAKVSPDIQARLDRLGALVAGEDDYDAYFAPGFLAALPKAKWNAVVAQLIAQLGKPAGPAAGTPGPNPNGAYFTLPFERGVARGQIAIDPAPPHRVASLLFSGIERRNDSYETIAAEFAKLPGKGAFGVFALDAGTPRLIAGTDVDRPAPLGSAFKLWVLGELARDVAAGERRWGDVVPLGPPSLPSGITQGWPAGTPMTLQALATLMISISDNTATDTLVALEGRKLDAFVAARGASALSPILTTRQIFALKAPANADLAARWAATAPSARRALLDASAARLAATAITPGMFAGKPLSPETLEWFASPADIARMLDWLRQRGGPVARAILSVNPGVDGATAGRFAYIGFKGGSEPGVITLNYLVQRKDGRWLAIAANWHRADAEVETATFTALANRLLTLAAREQ